MNQPNQTSIITDLEHSPSRLIQQAKNGPITITKLDGTPVAVLLSINDYERLRRLVEEFDGIPNESKTI